MKKSIKAFFFLVLFTMVFNIGALTDTFARDIDGEIRAAEAEKTMHDQNRRNHDRMADQYDAECRQQWWTCVWNTPRALLERSLAAIDQGRMNLVDGKLADLRKIRATPPSPPPPPPVVEKPKIIAPPPVAKPTPPPSPPSVVEKPKVDPITKNALGNPEYCFGAVGKGCGGFGDLKDDETKATRPGYLAAGCSEEVNGKRRCWVVPGSIKHDNCCVGHPSGKHCGGPGKKDWFGNVEPAGESNHDGNCDKEWDDAFWDVKNGRGWEFDFTVKEAGNLTPATSPSNRYSGGERVGTVGLCAPNDASISARHNAAFCCSGNAKKYWAAGVEDWLICEPKSGRSVQQIGGKQEGTPTQLNMAKTPSKPGEPKQQPIAVVKKPAMLITDFEPKEGGTRTRVTLKGENLNNATLAVLGCSLENAKQNHPKCLRIVIEKISDKKVEVQMMPEMNVVAPIVLFSPEDGYVATPSNFSCYPWPEIKEILPKNPRPGEIVELIGKNLYAVTSVSVAGEKTHTPEVNHYASEGGSLKIKLPKDAPAEGTINVATKGGHTWIAYKLGLILPYISRVEPAKARPGDVVSVYGDHLGYLKNVAIGNTEAKTYGKKEKNNILVIVPNAPAGKYELSATNDEGTGKWDKSFEVLGKPIVKKPEPPKITPQPALLPPPPPPSQVAKKKPEILPQPALRPISPPPSEEKPKIAVRHEPQPEPVAGHCERGTWSPTLRTCIEDKPIEEVKPQDCERGSWSPTLKMCVE